MPSTKPRRNTRRPSVRRRSKQSVKLSLVSPAVVPGEKSVRGVKLKTVSAFTMLFALLCLFAFMAGRVDVAAMSQPPMVAKARPSVPKARASHKRSMPEGTKGAIARDSVRLATF